MGKLNQDFTTWKGNYRRIDFYIEDVSSVTGGTASWIMAADATSAALITKTVAGGGIGLTGKTVSVYLLPADTDDSSGIADGIYYHELRLVDVVNQPSTPAIGEVTLLPVVLKT
jgi:hypothetical protein